MLPVVLVLDSHLVQQRQERLAAGDNWVENGLMFTTPTGEMLHPADVTDHFYLRLDKPDSPRSAYTYTGSGTASPPSISPPVST